ncbi:segregation and condensation protein B [Geobacillus sp. GHH01]|uniref:Chromosome segregation and condensation protein, ScpB n=1 Tax=Geobacillus sp. (strain Y412MC52) TaxID=550542 RepID=A0ACD6B8I3_GEOS2|nr:chromosome segregation and condensation protein, ScpB [Geobacillus sp. C56-T3]ADU94672.1 chromosome segregation and condensation protein, ScpB [Geobacillus sp. Y412MC52]AGE22888.1 segregation and condensation protein B [Geobacillus sp. GHH01]
MAAAVRCGGPLFFCCLFAHAMIRRRVDSHWGEKTWETTKTGGKEEGRQRVWRGRRAMEQNEREKKGAGALKPAKAIVEALLFAAGDEGLSLSQIAAVLEVSELEAKAVIEELQQDCRREERGIQLVELGGVFLLATKKEHAPYLKKLVEAPGASPLSQAALETLAIIAYRQPITRAEIEEIRGVKSDKPLQTLMARALIKEVGRAEGTGRPILYGTTPEFLDYFGLKTLEELPPLPEWADDGESEREADLFFEKLAENLSDGQPEYGKLKKNG